MSLFIKSALKAGKGLYRAAKARKAKPSVTYKGGVESAGVTKKLGKNLAPIKKGGMRTYGSLSPMGKVRSTARLFNPMNKNREQAKAARLGAGILVGGSAGSLLDTRSPKPAKSYKPAKPAKPAKVVTRKASKPKAESTKKKSRYSVPKSKRSLKGAKFGKKYR